MKQYTDLVRKCLTQGNIRTDRTNTGTISIFGPQMEFDLSKGFPLDTGRQLFLRGILEENFWMLRGSTDNNELVERRVHIWDEWALTQKEIDKDGMRVRLRMLMDALVQEHGSLAEANVEYSRIFRAGLGADEMADVLRKYGVPPVREYSQAERLELLQQKMIANAGEGEDGHVSYLKVTAEAVDIDQMLGELGIPKIDAKGSGFKIGDLGPVYGDQWRFWGDPKNDVEQVLTIEQRIGIAEDMLAAGTAQKFTQVELDELKAYCRNTQNETGGALTAFGKEKVHMRLTRFGVPKTVNRRSTIDQITKLIDDLKKRPNSRRHVVSAWNVSALPDESLTPHQNVMVGKMALAPCHALFQFYVEERSVADMMNELGVEQAEEYERFLADNMLSGIGYPDSIRGHTANPAYWELMFNFEKKSKITDWFEARGIKTKKLSCKLYQRSH